MRKFLILGFFISLIIYFLTSAGKTPYDYFTRLSDAFLDGRYYLTQSPPWLSELVPVENEKYFVIQPPMPAILTLPFRFLLKENFQQQYLAHILGALTVVFTMILSYRIKKDRKLAVWLGILVGLGSIVWYLSATGSVWYLGQVSSLFFLTAALVESFGKKRPLLMGVFIGAAFLSRLHTILSLPLFIFLLKVNRKNVLKKLLLLGIGMAPFFLFNFYYNFIRFETIFDKGYFLVPGILNEPWFSKGMLSIAYIPEHLRILFLGLPKILSQFPHIQPSWYGLSILITTPAFIFAFKASIKENLTKMLWLSILFIFIIIALRGGTGWTQFGYRYAVDFYPFLTVLTIKGVSQTGLKWYHWLLLIFGIVVNLWGVLWINKFGWVSF